MKPFNLITASILIALASPNILADTSFVGKKIICTGNFSGYALLRSYEFISAKKAIRKSYHVDSSAPSSFPLDIISSMHEIHMGSYTQEGWGRYEDILDRRTLNLNYVTVNDTIYMNCEVFNGSTDNLDKLMIEKWNTNRKNSQKKNKL